MKKILYLITVMVLSAGISAQSLHSEKGSSTWIDGIWNGLGYQIDSDETWIIELKADSAVASYLIHYPDLNCRGSWEPESIDGYAAVFIEKIEKGEHSCIDGGLIKVSKIDENHISFSYFMDDGSVGAFSTLVRKRSYEKNESSQ